MLFKGFEMVDEQGQLLVKCDTGAELVNSRFAHSDGQFIRLPRNGLIKAGREAKQR